MGRIGPADSLDGMTAQDGAPSTGAPVITVSRAAGPLILSDTLLQGMRYLLLLYVGYRSLPYAGAFLLGSALGAVLGGLADFGINQNWLRLTGLNGYLNQRTFVLVLRGKVLVSLVGILCMCGGIALGIWGSSLPVAMVVGIGLAGSQVLAETCEAVALSLHRYRTVVVFRVLMSAGMYAVPLLLAWFLRQEADHAGLDLALLAGLSLGGLLCGLYAWRTRAWLPEGTQRDIGYRRAWWEARWLGFNQLAVVLDVRAPLLILGFMLGEAAVGLYGLVQRTTAVVELAWASVSRLLLRSYSELVGEKGPAQIKARVGRAGLVTAAVVAIVSGGLWGGLMFSGRLMIGSAETALALSLLQWAIVAIGLSSIKRPFVSGLMALFHERLVCRVNIAAALLGLLLVPLCILHWGIWGPVIAWIMLECAACLVLVWEFLRVADRTAPAMATSASGRMSGFSK